MSTHLTWDVSTSQPIPTFSDPPPPGAARRMWPPVSSTLICGREQAVLVDAPITVDQATKVADWVAQTRRRLVSIYVTHAHADHWLGASVILTRFPEAQVFATPAVAGQINQQRVGPGLEIWRERFPGQIAASATWVDALTNPVFELEGEPLIAIELGHTDTDHTTCLHSPTLGLVAAGDAVYNDVHLLLRDGDEARQQWLQALDVIEALRPAAVVAGHKRADRADGPLTIQETRQYILDFERVLASTATPAELFAGMTELHPHRLYPGALWASALELRG
jgi:glyoxylase-like metal-dependent hydrolase (beta-lactamase superfamily II)